MTFGLNLKGTLEDRSTRVPMELESGQSLEQVLTGHLVAVESTAETVMLTSVLLLDEDGKRLWHAAAPSLPRPYCEAINGVEIGPTVGSCGTAAFHDHAIYVADIANDPLWSDYCDLALSHGLRACWSTPIHDCLGALLGTFAVYHLRPRCPTKEEVEAIKMITAHVASAIRSYRTAQDLSPVAAENVIPLPRNGADARIDADDETEEQRILESLEADFEQIASAIDRTIKAFPHAAVDGLLRAKRAASRGQALARSVLDGRHWDSDETLTE